MGRSAQEEIKQDQCIKFIIGVGLVAFLVCLFPLAFDLTSDSKYVIAWIPHHITRVSVVAATLPLLWDYTYDLTLPQRLTYPRTTLLIAILVPNVTVLLMSAPSRHEAAIRLSMCLAFAKNQLFHSGLIAYIAGETSSKTLLAVLALVALWGSSCNIFFTVNFFVTSAVPIPVIILVSSVTALLVFVMLVWYVRDMKTLDERRRMFAMTFIIATGTYALLKHIIFALFKILHWEYYIQDSFLIIEVLTATGVSIITSRMAQHDATIAMVSAG